MSKNHSKNVGKEIRQPINEQTSVNKMTDQDRIRVAMGKQARLDASQYLRDPAYKDMTFFWSLTQDGEVDKWLGLGAQPVPKKSKAVTTYKGLNDNIASEWECVPGVGVDEAGRSVSCYLLMMETEEYEKLRIKPKEDRNAAILEAMGIGKIQEESRVSDSPVKGLKTYAPNLPTGGRGLEQKQEIVHDV